MHDFCLTLPYGALVALGGLIGFIAKGGHAAYLHALRGHLPCPVTNRCRLARRAGSVPSLIAGGGSGVLLMLLGVLSLKAWKTGTKGASTPYTLASAGARLRAYKRHASSR